jgi:hypothetical protein
MHKQRGMTFIGVVLLIAVIVFVAVIGMKLTPAYLEFMSVKKVLSKIANEPDFQNMGKNDIIMSFQKSALIDNIKAVSGSDLAIAKDETGKSTVSVEYQVIVPLMGNVSALLDFEASTEPSN